MKEANEEKRQTNKRLQLSSPHRSFSKTLCYSRSPDFSLCLLFQLVTFDEPLLSVVAELIVLKLMSSRWREYIFLFLNHILH